VVFVLLIMFIVIAPLLELDRIQLASSDGKALKEATTVNESSPISIQVRADDTIYFNKRRVSARELLTALELAKKQHPRQIPQLFHDKQAHFGTYQTVKNAIENAGFEQLDIILEPG
jgi:biopolymer transport protein ExbD